MKYCQKRKGREIGGWKREIKRTQADLQLIQEALALTPMTATWDSHTEPGIFLLSLTATAMTVKGQEMVAFVPGPGLGILLTS